MSAARSLSPLAVLGPLLAVLLGCRRSDPAATGVPPPAHAPDAFDGSHIGFRVVAVRLGA